MKRNKVGNSFGAGAINKATVVLPNRSQARSLKFRLRTRFPRPIAQVRHLCRSAAQTFQRNLFLYGRRELNVHIM